MIQERGSSFPAMNGVNVNPDFFSGKRILIWGFEDEMGLELCQSLERSGAEIASWLSDHPKADNMREFYRLSDWSVGRIRNIREFAIIREGLHAELLKSASLMTRHYVNFEYDLNDLLDGAEILLRAVYNKLSEVRPEILIMGNVPHEGADVFFYEVAKAMGVHVVCFYQQRIHDRFFAFANRNSYENLWKLPNYSSFTPLSLERGQREVHFDVVPGVCSLDQPPVEFAKLKLKSFLRYAQGRLRRRSIELSNSLSIAQSRWNSYLNSMRTNELTASESSIAMETSYVYFPLALQPELTTSVLGVKYSDQLTALELLSGILPAGWSILVKENPKQNEQQRGALFMERLLGIPRVKIVHHRTDTHELSERSELVAVITGTAGWEAIKKGIPCLFFGKPWYRGLHGTFEFEPRMDLSEIAGFQIDHSLLEKSYSELMTHAFCGVADAAYRVGVTGYDARKNAEVLKDAVFRVLTEEENAQ